ncbi:MarR family winged helix-turn-helix transcriptional regulator [Companilactobacillus ginsenosidimutans]|uniref:HTH marR-type domain-containing protein n=1 Tax=Companilactobacillus ginsenosidimutans TaxID=1007676 RepID=A0A0H4QKN5_9LACO|nr:MarR family transcriptional regulator [Companilactobacillus ginsenosidimutans]AKP67661.1 hypothetical protein ABM34_09060 [Companilactobacillus ginsenosidimutans]
MEIDELIDVLYRLKLADLNMSEMFKSQTNSNLTRYAMLLYLKHGGEMTQTHIQNKLEINSSAITRHLKNLEEEGFVTRVRNPQNNREVMVNITSAAEGEIASCSKTPAAKKFLKLVSQEFTPAEIVELSQLLQRLSDLELK